MTLLPRVALLGAIAIGTGGSGCALIDAIFGDEEDGADASFGFEGLGSASMDAVTAGQALSLEWYLRAPSGVAFTTFWIRHDFSDEMWSPTPSCNQGAAMERASGTRFDGIYQTVCETPQDAKNGTYTVRVEARDENDQVIEFTIATILLSGGTADDSPPMLLSSSVTPSTVEAGGAVVLEWRLASPSGVTFTTFLIRNDDIGVGLPSTAECNQGLGVALDTGTEYDGTYNASCQTLPGAQAGVYPVRVQVEDQAGNIVIIPIGSLTITGGTNDPSPPTLENGSVSPSPLEAGALLSLTWQLASPSGVVFTSFFLRNDDTGTGMPSTIDCNQGSGVPLQSGTVNNGIYQASCLTLPGALAGNWSANAYVEDQAGNATQMLIDNFVMTGGTSDPSPPTLVSGSATPGVIAPGGTVSLEWRLTSPSGVVHTSFSIQTPGGGVLPSTIDCNQGLSLALASGNEFDGTYQASCKTPAGAVQGTYNARAHVEDQAGNIVLLPIDSFTISGG